jgi:hypothetical protein
MENSKYSIYAISLSALFLVGGFFTVAASSTQMPANKVVEQSDEGTQKMQTSSPSSSNGKANTLTKQDHKNAEKTLSPKNKAAYQTLSKKDKQKVVEAHKNGDSAQEKLNDVLNEDAKSNGANPSPDKNENSPASKAMNRSKDQNVYD